jgi:hypothetical protein
MAETGILGQVYRDSYTGTGTQIMDRKNRLVYGDRDGPVSLLKALKDVGQDGLELAAVSAGVAHRSGGVVQDVVHEEQTRDLKRETMGGEGVAAMGGTRRVGSGKGQHAAEEGAWQY